MNPFLNPFQTPYQIPPFDEILDEHYRDAFMKGIAEQEEEYAAIENNPELPTFENTLAAIERSGSLLKKVCGVFDNLVAADTNDERNIIDREMSPKRAAHRNRFWLSTKMFRIDSVPKSSYAGAKSRATCLWAERHRMFVQKGVQLDEDKRGASKRSHNACPRYVDFQKSKKNQATAWL